jgi:2,5-diketo-D-gluconate reductase A
LVKETGVTPAINQIELHPGFQQRELKQVHQEMGIVTQTWSPLGQGKTINHETIRAIAEETGQPAGAVIIRWHIQHGFLDPAQGIAAQHMEDNFKALSFTLSDEQMARIDELDDAEGRIGPDPNNFS